MQRQLTEHREAHRKRYLIGFTDQSQGEIAKSARVEGRKVNKKRRQEIRSSPLDVKRSPIHSEPPMTRPPEKLPAFLFEEVADPAGVGSKPVETKLTRKEDGRRARLIKARARLDKLEEEIAAIEFECIEEKHRVRYDVGGMPFDARYCAVCGAALGVI